MWQLESRQLGLGTMVVVVGEQRWRKSTGPMCCSRQLELEELELA